MSTSSRTWFDWQDEGAFAGRAAGMKPSAIREFLKLLGQPGIVSFAGGIPDPALFPSDAIAQAAARITGDPALCSNALQYAASEGYEPLLEWIAGYMGDLGVPCTIDNIVITTGSQQGLDLLGKLFLDPGDTLLVTAPTYLGALQAFSVYEPVFAKVDPGSGAVYGDIASSAMAYVIPDFANPTGETVPRSSRERLLDTITSLGVPVVEDAAYQALRFDGEPIPSLLALDVMRTGHIDRSRVIYAGTFSKTIAPGLRVGWICAARPVIQKVVRARQAADLHGSTLDQAILHEVVTARFDEQVQRLLPVYRHRRDVMLDALARFMPTGVSWTRPEGGMFIWLTLPETLDSLALLRDSLEEERVIFVPGPSFFADGSGERHLRLNYTRSDDATIVDGIERLGRLVERHIHESMSGATGSRPVGSLGGVV
jgi:DNA-binding transcriptional MocR family regulator